MKVGLTKASMCSFSLFRTHMQSFRTHTHKGVSLDKRTLKPTHTKTGTQRKLMKHTKQRNRGTL